MAAWARAKWRKSHQGLFTSADHVHWGLREFGLAELLITFASWDEAAPEGRMLEPNGEPMTRATIAKLARTSVADLERVLAPIKRAGFARDVGDTLVVVGFGKWQRGDSTLRTRTFRERRGEQFDANVPGTQGERFDATFPERFDATFPERFDATFPERETSDVRHQTSETLASLGDAGAREPSKKTTVTKPGSVPDPCTLAKANGSATAARSRSKAKKAPQTLDLRVLPVLDAIDRERARHSLAPLPPSERLERPILTRIEDGIPLEDLVLAVELHSHDEGGASRLNASTPFTGPSGRGPGGWSWSRRLLDEHAVRVKRDGDAAERRRLAEEWERMQAENRQRRAEGGR